MRIGILTFHYCNNYGAVLQAYALKRFLEMRDHQVELIDYIPRQGNGALPHTLKQLLQEGYIRLMNGYSACRLDGKFRQFRKKYLTLSKERYFSLDELKKAPPQYDAYICGSDQIWNPQGTAFHEPYFLTFVPEGKCKLSYAASFGTPLLEEKFRGPLRRYLSSFNGISVREKSGIDLIRDFAEKDAMLMADPTLLHDDYSFLYAGKKMYPEKYLLVYRLQQSAPLTRSLTRLIDRVAKELGLPVYNISPHRFRFFLEHGKTIYPSPEEWCGWIANASFIVTNSFHGSVFSILNRKPFIAFPRVAKDGQNDRIINLLSKFSLNDHYIQPESLESFQATKLSPYLPDLLTKNLSVMREQASQYLETILSRKDS